MLTAAHFDWSKAPQEPALSIRLATLHPTNRAAVAGRPILWPIVSRSFSDVGSEIAWNFSYFPFDGVDLSCVDRCSTRQSAIFPTGFLCLVSTMFAAARAAAKPSAGNILNTSLTPERLAAVLANEWRLHIPRHGLFSRDVKDRDVAAHPRETLKLI